MIQFEDRPRLGDFPALAQYFAEYPVPRMRVFIAKDMDIVTNHPR